jgi:hypothetical protein
MGTHIGRGAYTAAFWVLRKTGTGYKVVLRDDAQALNLLDERTNGVRGISLSIANLRSVGTWDFAFDGSVYKIAKRTQRPNMSEIQRDLSKYETHKPFIQVLGQDEEPILAEARAWIWQRWQAHKRSYVDISTEDADGERHACRYIIDDLSETGDWQVTLEIWDQDTPSGPRYLVLEDHLKIASGVERIQLTEDDSRPHILADKDEIPASKYRLNFLDGNYSVFVL